MLLKSIEDDKTKWCKNTNWSISEYLDDKLCWISKDWKSPSCWPIENLHVRLMYEGKMTQSFGRIKKKENRITHSEMTNV